jgi:nitrogenase subunit NifH
MKTLYIIIGIAVISILAATILMIIEIKTRKKIREHSLENDYIKKLNRSLTSSIDNKKKIEEADLIAKEIFQKIMKSKKEPTYDEILAKYQNTKEEDIIKFARLMLKVYYSKETLESHIITEIRILLTRIIHSKKDLLKHEKTNLDN